MQRTPLAASNEMIEINGGCYCGNIRVQASLSKSLLSYHPRACDCDFCLKHAAAYVSDALGSLCIQIRHELQVNRFRQGSNSAEMLLCRTCGVLVGAIYGEPDRLFGTLNVQALKPCPSFGAEEAVSPKQLNAEQKIERWRRLWFPNVRLELGASGR